MHFMDAVSAEDRRSTVELEEREQNELECVAFWLDHAQYVRTAQLVRDLFNEARGGSDG